MTNDTKKSVLNREKWCKKTWWENLPSLTESLSLLIKGGGGLEILK